MEEKKPSIPNFGIVADKRYLEHETGAHVESPRRLRVIYDMLERELIMDKVLSISPRYASEEEVAMNHAPEYIRMLKNFGAGYLDADTVLSGRSYDTALLAVGGSLNMVDAIYGDHISRGFALVRPPGHHAEYNKSMGFCLFNNTAIAARHILQKYGLKRIAIFDWDLHHGNGTEHSFYDKSEVLYISIHQSPCYPGTGRLSDVGEGDGEGFNVNIPLPAGAGDKEYIQLTNDFVVPIISEYSPDIIFVSAGFDTHISDPLGGMNVTASGFGEMSRLIFSLADNICRSKAAFFLEGGYSLDGLGSSVKKVIQTAVSGSSDTYRPKDSGINIDVLMEKTAEIQRKYWNILGNYSGG